MSSKYVPPHKRNQAQLVAPSVKADRKLTLGGLDEKDFEPLARNEMKTVSKVDWKAVNFQAVHVQAANPHLSLPAVSTFPVHRSVVNVDMRASESEHESEIDHSQPANDDGWTLVEKKLRVKRDKVQEALDNGDAPLSDEDEEQSFWDDQPEEYETYWDRKP
jgi:hypothetical protein